MAQKTLNAYVVLSGRVDNTFGQIGTALINMGSTIDQISHKLIDFGKESIEVYRGYEDSMLDAQVALSTTYGRNTKVLNEVMRQLDAQATQWAATTIFHTDDVANAIAEAAHAGWDLDKIMSGIPEAMKLAQAGGLDLSQGLDYIIKTTNAAGIGFDELEGWVDLWTYTANRSAGDIESFGEAMTRMGSTMKFAGSREELLAMLAVLHDAGTVGSDAGTLLRNTMIRLVAPTKKATDAMAELGITQADIDEAFGEVDGDTAAAVKRLEELGFSAYDSQGNLKDFTDIFRDLSVALSGMSDEERNDILSAIFPTRTITGALALLGEVDGAWLDLLKDLYGGAAEGYGDYAAETMMSGLSGSIETFLSKVERLKQVTGAELAPQTETILGNIGKLVDYFASGGVNNGVSAGLDFAERVSGWIGSLADNLDRMDPVVFDGIVSALGSLATLGPGLLLAGGGIRFASYALGTHIGRLALGAALLVTCAEAFTKMAESDFEGKFGEMELDAEPLREQLKAIDAAFSDSTAEISAYQTALAEAGESYKALSSELSSNLLTDMLTGKELTQEDLDSYITMGEQMVGAVKDGIQAAYDQDAVFFYKLWQSDGTSEEDTDADPVWQAIQETLQSGYDTSVAEAERIGNDIRQALTDAISNDGVIDAAEREKIAAYFRELNQVMAEEEARQQGYAARALLYNKAQGLSFDAVVNFIDEEIGPQRESEKEAARQWYAHARGALDAEYDEEIAAAKNRAERDAIEKKYQPMFAATEGKLNAWLTQIDEWYAQMVNDLTSAALADSELGDADKFVQGLMDKLQAGTMTAGQAWAQLQESEYSSSEWWKLWENADYENLGQYYRKQIDALGGPESVVRMWGDYRRSGQEQQAQEMENLLRKYTFVTSGGDASQIFGRSLTGEGLAETEMETLARAQTTIDNSIDGKAQAYLNALLEAGPDTGNYAYTAGLGAQMSEAWSEIAGADRELLTDMAGMFGEMYDYAAILASEERTKGAEPSNLDASLYALARLLSMGGAEAEKYRIGAEAPAVAPAATPTAVEITGVEEEAGAARAIMDGTLGEPVQSSVTFPDATTNAQIARQAMEAQFRTPITQYVQVQQFGASTGSASLFSASLPKKARGGRETQPSIFAEAGIPEWYIPEEHTANTARLILGAAYGSGFDILELAAMAGARLFAEGGTSGTGTIPGLAWGALASGGGSSGGVQVEYAPVIHADSAEGVGRVLEEDKKRLRKMMNEWWKDKERMVSLTAY